MMGIWSSVAKSLSISREAKNLYYGKFLDFENTVWAKQNTLNLEIWSTGHQRFQCFWDTVHQLFSIGKARQRAKIMKDWESSCWNQHMNPCMQSAGKQVDEEARGQDASGLLAMHAGPREGEGTCGQKTTARVISWMTRPWRKVTPPQQEHS